MIVADASRHSNIGWNTIGTKVKADATDMWEPSGEVLKRKAFGYRDDEYFELKFFYRIFVGTNYYDVPEISINILRYSIYREYLIWFPVNISEADYC